MTAAENPFHEDIENLMQVIRTEYMPQDEETDRSLLAKVQRRVRGRRYREALQYARSYQSDIIKRAKALERLCDLLTRAQSAQL